MLDGEWRFDKVGCWDHGGQEPRTTGRGPWAVRHWLYALQGQSGLALASSILAAEAFQYPTSQLALAPFPTKASAKCGWD
jgi:hypothetical protein